MKVTFKSLTLNYEARFQTPFFRVGDARPALLEALYRALAQFGIDPADLQGSSGISLADQKVRVNLFRGNAFIEITAGKVTAEFRNAVGKEDVGLIQTCIKKLLAAIEVYANDAPLGAERLVLYPWIEFDSEDARKKFLDTLPPLARIPEVAEKLKSKLWPHYKVEMEDPTGNWQMDVSVSRAWDHPKALFVSAHASFLSGANSGTLDQRANMLAEAVGSVFKVLGIQAE